MVDSGNYTKLTSQLRVESKYAKYKCVMCKTNLKHQTQCYIYNLVTKSTRNPAPSIPLSIQLGNLDLQASMVVIVRVSLIYIGNQEHIVCFWQEFAQFCFSVSTTKCVNTSEIDVSIYAYIWPLSFLISVMWEFFFCRNVGWYCTRLPRVDRYNLPLFVVICSQVSYCIWLYYNGKNFTFSQVPFTIYIFLLDHCIPLYFPI